MAPQKDTVLFKFKYLFEQDKLNLYSTINDKYFIKNERFIKITSLNFNNFYQLIYIGWHGMYLDVYQIIKLENSKIKIEGEMKEKELPARIEVLSWIDSVRKTLIKAIEEVKNIK
ncbi:MAG: hypothetical protein ACFFDN_05300 [Candidatus Hodarchaeota archaeon]